MAEGLDTRCDRSHRHQHLAGGRAAAAAFYPLPLVRAKLQEIRATADAERVRNDGEADRLEYVHATIRPQLAGPLQRSRCRSSNSRSLLESSVETSCQ